MRVRMLPMWAVGAAIATFAIAAPALRAESAPASACTATAGVTVIIDFSYFHHDIERGCAPGHPASALAALHAAGFQTAGTAQYGDAFVCRIDGLPSPAKESCAQTPPANSSWSFYTARPTDAEWTYATTAVTLVRPAAGTLVAFAFGSYAKPAIRPSAGIATPTTTIAPPTTTNPTPPETVSAQSSSTTIAPTPGVTSSRPSAAPTSTSATPPTTSSTAVTPNVTTSTRAPLVVNEQAGRAAPHNDSGSPVPVALTVGLVAVLGLGAGLIIAARRRSSA